MAKNAKILGIAAAVMGAGLIASTTNVLAEEVTSNGGLMVGLSEAPHWFSIHGAVKLDQHQFVGSKQSKGAEFFSGANLRDLDVDFSGGVGQDISYTLGFNFDARNSKVDIADAYLTYSGFGNNFDVSAGRVNPGFSIENTSSGKWIPLLERSMASTALGASSGMGFNLTKWNDYYSIYAAVVQPRPENRVTNVSNDTEVRRTDKWSASTRLTRALLHEGSRIFQVGVSGFVQDDGKAAMRLQTAPEVKARNIVNVLDTGKFGAKHHEAVSFELAGQDGPLYAEAEYKTLRVKRAVDTNFSNPEDTNHFHGYHVQAAYVLTGEARVFKPKQGVFGQVKPSSPKGAWEVAGRYSFLNLNHKDIRGGSGHNLGAGLNYYLNDNVGIFAEYLFSRLNPTGVTHSSIALANSDARKLHIFGLRLQTVF